MSEGIINVVFGKHNSGISRAYYGFFDGLAEIRPFAQFMTFSAR
jgi:hypothetical protein